MTTHTWPQVPPFTGSRRGTDRARWPSGIALATLSACALLAACGGNGCDEQCQAEEAAAEQPAAAPEGRKGIGPVDCVRYPERCS